jgi:uncharacterized repeat protein (TIGR01451 family)
VGLAIDTDSEFLFVTYEVSNTIQLVNAKTMTDEGTTTAPNANNLAGIVVDHDNSLVYTVDRNTNSLYIYDWDAASKTLTLDHVESLSGVSQAHGIALDEVNDLLYVGDRTTIVKVFNTGDWSSAGSFPVSQPVMGIAVDVANGFVYTGNAYAGYGSIHRLCKYDLNNNIETYISLGSSDNVLGLSVDQATSLLYITTGDQASGGSDELRAYDSDLNLLDQTGDIGNPTGLCVGPGYNPLDLTKVDNVADDDCVDTGDTVTYTICFNNLLNQYAVHDVTIVDTLPANASFVSATGGGTYIPAMHTVAWIIGTVPAGSSGACVTLTVSVNAGAENTTLTNCAVIDGDEVGPTQSCVDTDVCEGEEPPCCVPVPVGPGPSGVTGVPLLTPFGAVLLIGLLAIVGAVGIRRRT